MDSESSDVLFPEEDFYVDTNHPLSTAHRYSQGSVGSLYGAYVTGGVTSRGCGSSLPHPARYRYDVLEDGHGRGVNVDDGLEDAYTLPAAYTAQAQLTRGTVNTALPGSAPPKPARMQSGGGTLTAGRVQHDAALGDVTVEAVCDVTAADGDGVTLSRRRTWSPPTFRRVLSGTTGKLRTYRSDDQLDTPDVTSEDETVTCAERQGGSGEEHPPLLQPSGFLHTPRDNCSLVKPIACKPVMLHKANILSPKQQRSAREISTVRRNAPSGKEAIHTTRFGRRSQAKFRHSETGQDEGYRSEEYGSLKHGDARSPAAGEPHTDTAPLRAGLTVAAYGRVRRCSDASHSTAEASRAHTGTTPSPSDSGLGELESLLRAREQEVAQLRRTMERNEAAILEVWSEKEQAWQREKNKLVEEWNQKLHQQRETAKHAERTLRVEAARSCAETEDLGRQLAQCESERARSQHALQRLTSRSVTVEQALEAALTDLQRSQQEALRLTSELSEQRNEALALRQELKQEQYARARLGSQLQELQELQAQSPCSENGVRSESTGPVEGLWPTRETDAESPESFHTFTDALQRSTTSLQNPDDLRRELEVTRKQFAHEREKWHLEKEKVIRYQKHLQLNYIQMVRKNTCMEQELEQLTLELEGRDSGLREGDESLC